jgi:S1-C subfamily serine protease
VALVLAGCASTQPPSRRGDALREMLDASVQLRAEREGGGRRWGSGVVVASDAGSGQSWILTTRHFLEPTRPQQVFVTTTVGQKRVRGRVRAVSSDLDLAILEVPGVVLTPATLQDEVRLGDEVRVVGFPFGRRLTVVSGIVSQIVSEDSEVKVQGPVQTVDATVTYGASGGGVFDATTGALVGIVEGYRTTRVTLQTEPEKVVDIPMPGETGVLGVPSIRRFLEMSGVMGPR